MLWLLMKSMAYAGYANLDASTGKVVSSELNVTGTGSSMITFNSANTVNGSNSVRYIPLNSITGTLPATEINTQVLNAIAGKISNLRVYAHNSSIDHNTTFTIRINGVDSAVTLTLPASTASGDSGALSATIATGDLLSISILSEAGVAGNCSPLIVSALIS